MPKKRQLLRRRADRATDWNSNAMHKLAAGQLLEVVKNSIWNAKRFRTVMWFDPSSLRLELDNVKQVWVLIEDRLNRRGPRDANAQLG